MNTSRVNKIVILTDLHLRSDYMPGFLNKQVETLLYLANRKPCSHVVINGDVFERRNPNGEELLAFEKLLSNIKCKNIIVTRGNHDTLRKDGTSDTVLDLFKSQARIVKDTETIHIGGIDFDFIPHYEDEDRIVEDLMKNDNITFGHFGFDGCISNGSYVYDARVKRKHLKHKPYVFLGHIHKPKVYGNVVILGTQYSNTFGEANTQKFVHELIIRDKEVELIRQPINVGIRHIICTIDELEAFSKKYRFDSFYTILRVKLDRLDEYTENKLKEEVFSKYRIKNLELVFEDVLPKFESGYVPENRIFSLDDKVISEYINAHETIFSTPDIMDALEEIRRETK